MSAEIATSPATRLACRRVAGVAGNDSTSVGLFAPRNRWLRDRNSALLVTRTSTGLRSRTARRARNTNRSSVDELNPAIFLRRITTLLPVRSLTHGSQNKQEGPVSALHSVRDIIPPRL